ncbi:Vitamin B12 import ATP-binding protein BtuD (plasmid) [Caballeronia sp. SBC1]|uniref:ABC transporter ATP-binding protein n=1 Tax=unclassified Caballeronia TaxID=2646786 RepID=UPI0013E175E4|nr:MULTISPECIES: ABC transporter ATP-binding protein [unclassified Caballeronia]QIE27277.1 Vitamin B12 import ATP-binding protein BtuD [Caballeronia sp. SBC2]QIN65242.1 Vitamin B12 import ATP-binding protein BtuD [Caballeronia sp. SBC1]
MYFDLRLWQLTKGLRGHMVLSIAVGLLALVAGIARFVFLGQLLALVLRGSPWQSWVTPSVAVAAAIVLRALLDQWRTSIACRTAARAQETLRGELYDRIVALGPAWFAEQRTGGVMLSVIDGVEQLQTFFGQYLPQLAVALCAPFAIFGFIAFWDLPVAAVLLVAALVALFGPIAVHMHERRTSLARAQAFKEFGETFLDAVQGLPTLKAFGQSRVWGERLATQARAVSDNTFWVLAAGLLTRGIVDLGAALGAALALVLGAWRVTHGQMGLTTLLIVLMAGTEIFRPLRDLRSVLHQGMLGQAATAGIRSLLEANPPMPEAGTDPLRDTQASLDFDNVRFAYAGGRGLAHRGLTFSVAAGERIGIVGPSGAGKSSIVRLLLRQYDPQSGSIRIAGQDVRTLDPDALRAKIAVVAQDTMLFAGTVEENLRLGRPDATADELEAAARAAYAHDFISSLPDGYQTSIGERGVQLSGGQRQRLAIARALLRDAPILILDEALSAVDAENEALIQRALDRLMQGRTTLILAHRLSSVIGADRILVLDDGLVAESGTHNELMKRSGLYHRLMAAQATPHRVSALRSDAASLQAGVPAAPLGKIGHAGDTEEDAVQGPRELDADARILDWKATLASLVTAIHPWRVRLALTILLGVGRVTAFIGVGVLGAWLVSALRAGDPHQAIAAYLLLVAPLAAVLHWLESWLAHDMAYRLLADLRIRLFRQLDRLAPGYLLRRRSGDLVTLATQDVETIEYFYAHTVAPAVVAVLVPAAVITVLATAAWPLALGLLPFLAYAMLSPVRGRSRIDVLGSKARESLGLLGAHMTETIQGLSDLLAFQATGRRREAFMALAREYSVTRLALLADLARQTALLDVATGLGGLTVAIVGAWLVSAGQLSAAWLPMLILLAVAAFMPVAEIAQVGRQLADTIASARRLRVVHDEPVRVLDGERDLQPSPGGSEVRFEDARFAYAERAQPVLNGVSFRVRAGSTAALVGASGAGKSTIANLLLRFWDPDTGSVQLDGVDLRRLRLDSLRSHVALVSQDTYLFNDTLEANIRLARPDASADALRLALEQASLADFIATLPQGLSTRVGERGVQLSGGQRQRVAIARAFLKDAPVLVLDEATSHLDAISEAQVHAALKTLMANRTTLIIAHRLATVREADLIIVLDHGSVIEAGPHAQLLANNSVYAQLVNRQQVGSGLQHSA